MTFAYGCSCSPKVCRYNYPNWQAAFEYEKRYTMDLSSSAGYAGPISYNLVEQLQVMPGAPGKFVVLKGITK